MLNIIVRTMYFHVFMMFFTSFMGFENERLNELTVLIDEESEDIEKYKALQKKFPEDNCFNIKILSRNFPRFDYKVCGNIIYRSLSLSSNKTVSLDDDIVFLKEGFFEMLEKKLEQYNVIGHEYYSKTGERGLASTIIAINNVCFTPDDFRTVGKYGSKKDLLENYGIDTFKIYRNYKNTHDFIFFEDFIKVKKNSTITNFVRTEYYVHVGNITSSYRDLGFSKDIPLKNKNIAILNSAKNIKKISEQ